MYYHSTREAAKKLGVPSSTLANYVAVGKIRVPKAEVAGRTTTQLWTEDEIEAVRKLLPKLANGRKTRYHKKTQPRAAALPKKRGTKKR
jgi:hypothetical protein